jgi:hypothetical protein
MPGFTNLLVGLAGLAAVAIVVFAHDWREEHRQRLLMQPTRHHAVRDWWMRHRH